MFTAETCIRIALASANAPHKVWHRSWLRHHEALRHRHREEPDSQGDCGSGNRRRSLPTPSLDTIQTPGGGGGCWGRSGCTASLPDSLKYIKLYGCKHRISPCFFSYSYTEHCINISAFFFTRNLQNPLIFRKPLRHSHQLRVH